MINRIITASDKGHENGEMNEKLSVNMPLVYIVFEEDSRKLFVFIHGRTFEVLVLLVANIVQLNKPLFW